MINIPVIIIAKNGKSVSSTDIRDFAFHSSYSMYKIHDIKSGVINIYTGSQTGYVDIVHGLDYVPKFLVYINGQLFPSTCRCFVNTSKVRVTIDLGSPFNRYTALYYADQIVGYAYDDYYYIAGKHGGDGRGSAFHFPEINIGQGVSITSAGFELKNVVTTSGSDIKFKIYGIDQDNTGQFNDIGDAEGKPRTDAVRTKTQSANTNLFNFGDDWTSLLQEIVNRPGWSGGNGMGFLFQDNGTDSDKAMKKPVSDDPNSDAILTVTIDGTATSPFVNDVRVVVLKDRIA